MAFLAKAKSTTFFSGPSGAILPSATQPGGAPALPQQRGTV